MSSINSKCGGFVGVRGGRDPHLGECMGYVGIHGVSRFGAQVCMEGKGLGEELFGFGVCRGWLCLG